MFTTLDPTEVSGKSIYFHASVYQCIEIISLVIDAFINQAAFKNNLQDVANNNRCLHC